jgi:hypothetical protein
METMTLERWTQIQEWLTHESFQRGALLEPEGMIIGECLAEIDHLTQELKVQTERANDGWHQFNIVNSALGQSDAARVRYIEITKQLEAENAQLRRDIDRLRTGLSESLQLQRHYATLLNTWDGGQRITFDSVEKWLERLDAIRKEPRP